MKAHIKLITIKRQLQDLMNYPITREQAGDDLLTLDEAFDELLLGWMRYTHKNYDYASSLKWQILKRGWMTEKQADGFTDYCITGWRII